MADRRLGVRPPTTGELAGSSGRTPKVAFDRTRSLTRQEIRAERLWTAETPWLQGMAPALVVTQRLRAGDGHSVGMATRSLDSAFRRACALAEAARRGESPKEWLAPIRPERGGLQLACSREGSFESAWTFYGELVSFASSTPVSLASLAALALDTFAFSRWMRQKWVVRAVSTPAPLEPPRADGREGESELGIWSPEQTKGVINELGELARSGIGVEFHQITRFHDTRIVLYPNQRK